MRKNWTLKTNWLIILVLVVKSITLTGQTQPRYSVDSLEKEQINWYNLDAKEDKIIGVSTEKAYNELLANKKPKKKIIVAVIDAGVDIKHEDLQDKIWKNLDEVPDNGIDDDENGFIDDVYGWNFLGNTEGENIGLENMEYTRICKKYESKYGNLSQMSSFTEEQKKEYEYYKTAKKEYEKKRQEEMQDAAYVAAMENAYNMTSEILLEQTGGTELNEEIVKGIKPKNKQVKKAKKLMLLFYTMGDVQYAIKVYNEDIQNYMDYRLNKDYNPREIIGDDPEVLDDIKYGNPDVTGPDASHGTMVSSLIAAVRNNNTGINGIADNVEIMAIRTIPDGDEYDKDVANAIRYAVDNGANIINMSFGKQFSPQKEFVDDAIRYADEHNVLLIHAAGNDAINTDSTIYYPNYIYNNSNQAQAYITVGASAREPGKKLAASFSNFGKESVDFFAPGHEIVVAYPGNRYSSVSGTSFAAPVTSGIAALVWSYYPEITSLELKEILIASIVPYSGQTVLQPKPQNEEGKATKVKFEGLCFTGGIVNAYNALKLAEEHSTKHEEKQ